MSAAGIGWTITYGLKERVDGAAGWRRAALGFVAGGVSVAAFAPIFLWPILFFTLPVLFWLVESSPGWRTAASSAWWFAFGFFFFSLFWIGEAFLVEAEKFAVLLPVAVTVLPAGLALFWAAAAGFARALWPSGTARILLFALCLATAEWLRGHLFTGLPWNLIGYALTGPLVLMQGAALLGIYGLTALAALVFTAPLVLLSERRLDAGVRAFIVPLAIAFVPLAGLSAYGAWRLSEPVHSLPGARLRIVQPSVPQREKWMPEYQRRIFAEHLALSITNADGAQDGAAGVTHIVWPEAAMPFLPLEHPEALQAIADTLPAGTSLITGALRRDPLAADGTALPLAEQRLFNGIMVFNDEARLVAEYDKIHLVPFGEYLPLEPVLSALGLKKLTHGRGSFTPGSVPRPLLAVPGLPPAIGLVCYEALFPRAVVQGKDRPHLLFNVTNDGWFGNTSGPRQHFHQTRVRAVEEGVPLIRAANNGISAVIDRYGRAGPTLGLDVRGVIDSAVPADAGETPYARFGDVIFALILAAYALLAAWLGRRRR